MFQRMLYLWVILEKLNGLKNDMKQLSRIIDVLKYITRMIGDNQKTVLVLLLVIIFSDIFVAKIQSDIVYLSVLTLSAICAHLYSLKSNNTFFLCLLLLAVMFVSYVFTSASIVTEKASVWLILFWLFGVLQQWREVHV